MMWQISKELKDCQNAIDLDHLEVNLIFFLVFRGKNVIYDIFCDSRIHI